MNHKNYNFRNFVIVQGKQILHLREIHNLGVCTPFLWWLKPRLGLVDLNYNFESDWLIQLSDNNLANELGEIGFFKPVTIEEIVIFMIMRFNTLISNQNKVLERLLYYFETINK